MKLSKRQQMILDYIKNEVYVKGYPPSVREIATAVGLASSSTVHGHLSRLEKKGFIRRDPTKPRASAGLTQAAIESAPTRAVTSASRIGKGTAGSRIPALSGIR